MDVSAFRRELNECVGEVESLAEREGCLKQLEFELYVVRWGAELAVDSENEELARSVLREARELGSWIVGNAEDAAQGRAAAQSTAATPLPRMQPALSVRSRPRLH